MKHDAGELQGYVKSAVLNLKLINCGCVLFFSLYPKRFNPVLSVGGLVAQWSAPVTKTVILVWLQQDTAPKFLMKMTQVS